MRWKLLLLLLMAAALACSTRSPERAAEARIRTVLEVDNRSNLDMTIYVVERAGNRTRLGTVVAHTVDWLTIPARLMVSGIATLQFQNDPVGRAAEPLTHSINVTRGDTVTMIIPVR